MSPNLSILKIHWPSYKLKELLEFFQWKKKNTFKKTIIGFASNITNALVSILTTGRGSIAEVIDGFVYLAI